jgi:hypothetical protein
MHRLTMLAGIPAVASSKPSNRTVAKPPVVMTNLTDESAPKSGDQTDPMNTAVIIIGILLGVALVIGLVAVGVRFYLKKKELEKLQI